MRTMLSKSYFYINWIGTEFDLICTLLFIIIPTYTFGFYDLIIFFKIVLKIYIY